MLATLPPELPGRAGRVRERFHLDAPGWFQHGTPRRPPSPPSPVRCGTTAASRSATAAATHGAADLAPLGLVLKAGGSVPGRAGVGTSPRTYRVDRIVDVQPAGQRFERPAFDLAEHWASSADDFTRQVLRTSVRLRLSPRAQRLLPHAVDRVAAHDACRRRPTGRGPTRVGRARAARRVRRGRGRSAHRPRRRHRDRRAPAGARRFATVGQAMAARNASPAA